MHVAHCLDDMPRLQDKQQPEGGGGQLGSIHAQMLINNVLKGRESRSEWSQRHKATYEPSRPLAFNTTGEYEKASAYSMPENAYGTYRWHPVDGCAIRLSGLGECRCRGP